MVGNIATGEAAKFLIEAGADGVKVGIGPGSICTTRIVAGVGVPPLTAFPGLGKAAKVSGVPVIAVVGSVYAGDFGEAIAAGGEFAGVGAMCAAGEGAACGQMV